MREGRPARPWRALLLDLDGTLVTDRGDIRPRNLAALAAAHEAGVRVMLATGRSELGALPVVDALGFDTPAVVFNGAAVWCPVRRHLVEERILAEATVERALAFARESGAYPVVIRRGEKYAPPPRTAAEERAVRSFHGMSIVDPRSLPRDYAIRVTLFSDRHPSSAALGRGIERAVERPIYVTHFPLCVLPDHRQSSLLVADVQPPCRGKAEALRLLRELYGIPAAAVVAVGDATNDLPMLEAAGLGVAMANAMAEARRAARRTIGDNGSDAIAELVEELFLDLSPSRYGPPA